MKASRLLLVSALALSSSAVLTSFRLADSDEKPARNMREVPAFTRLALGNSARVVLRQGSPQRVEVEASAADQQWLETTVKGNQLRIGTRSEQSKPRWHQFEGPVVVYITMPVVTGLSVNGSGKLKAETDIKTDKLDVAMNGPGGLELHGVQAAELETSLNGSGEVLLGGNCPRHDASINGSGAVRAGKLRSETASVSIHGSGDAHIYATKTLKATVVGSGDVYVGGGAQVSSTTIGSGRVRQ
ncbi:head GIN domain-containing protein [Hymenobacter saemangeumensis]